ncbi:ABC transporter substrate-binding protein [Aliikangiella marina]|uniref:ABC transporter substrate-binding protein n=1 Tax=Aliikangiella marina TaxID=1712262 RepID=A0A545TD76_9GAMM|nr:ABC transporter substrate-binding protein [Aliikangiella marina]TQV75170.1 ABC transporter substrate-binding protein [Aliikangiella marina]
MRIFIAVVLAIFLAFVVLPAKAVSKLVTAGGTVTEIVFALGAGEQVVATDQSSTFPEATQSLPSVGYYRDMAAEGILSTGLDTLLVLEGGGRSEALKQVEAAGVKVIRYSKPNTIQGLLNLVSSIGKDIGKDSEAKALIQTIQSTLPEAALNTTSRALFLLSAGDRGLIAAGSETVPQLLFDYVGVKNVASHAGFKTVGLESLAVSQPDILIAPAHSVAGIGGPKAFCKQPALALLEAAKRCRLLVMDSLLALGMTPRVASAIKQLDSFIKENP